MLPTKWPDWLDSVWAKSAQWRSCTGTPAGEPLARHTWNVLDHLRALSERQRMWETIGRLPDGSAFWPVVFWAAFFHDWGKAARGFQRMLRGQGRWRHRHEVLSLAFLDWVEPLCTPSQLDGISSAILSHHLDENEIARLYPLHLGTESDGVNELVDELDDEIVHGMGRWLAEVVPAWIAELGFERLGIRLPADVKTGWAIGGIRDFRGEAADRIRRRLRKFRQLVSDFECGLGTEWALPGILLRGALLQSDHAASAHAEPVRTLRIQAETVLADVPESCLYDHQKQVADLCGSCILIAPTGSGKTEAGLLWAYKQQKDGFVSRLHYTLPYQASMNAMRERIERLFPHTVGLVHARSALAVYRSLMEQGYDPASAAQAAKLADTLARLRHHPIQISSPYQMLKAAYQLKGYEAILADLVGGAFVFDEIHAYDASRLALTLELSSFLRQKLGCRFLVMSATLPSHVRRRVEEALGNPPVVRATQTVFNKFSRHKLCLVEDEIVSESVLKDIVQHFQEGRSVLVTCNTVRRAQEVYRQLQTRIAPESLILVHSRFNTRDRIRKEATILETTGATSHRRRSMIVVSTQVVEVSLNIDLDVLYSDPAPLEALVQRFGRVNRLRRADKAPVYVCASPDDGQGVYLPGLVKRTVSVLRKWGNGTDVNEGAIEELLDEVYDGEPLEEWEARYRKAQTYFRRAWLENLYPFRSMPEMEEEFDKLFDGTEVLPAAYREEYLRLRDTSTFEAAGLLVPVSWNWLRAHSNKIQSWDLSWPTVLDVPYSTEFGLEMA